MGLGCTYKVRLSLCLLLWVAAAAHTAIVQAEMAVSSVGSEALATATGEGNGLMPVFVQEPEEEYYIVRGKAVTLTCKASNTAQLNFRCVGNWLDPQVHSNEELVDPHTGVHYLQTSIEVTRMEVEEYFGGYWCECHAWNTGPPNQSEPKKTKSRRGMVKIAYLRKRFEREPINTEIEVSSSTQLLCLAPPGAPTPEVFWLKDDKVIDVDNDINFIITNEGNLIINQARLKDMGNYTCGAQNVAGIRRSESALLIVYVNGAWTTWSPWSECSIPCGDGSQKRSRHCSNPKPVNTARPCEGDEIQNRACTSVCPDGRLPDKTKPAVNGEWSTWSSWSTCRRCRRHRRRLCNNPKPDNGGIFCSGNDIDGANCTLPRCTEGGVAGRGVDDMFNNEDDGDYPSSSSSEMEEENMAMYVGLFVSVGIFLTIVIIIIIIVVLRRKSHIRNAGDKKLNKTAQEGSVQPDITKTIVTMQNPNMLHSPNNNHIGSSEKVDMYSDNAINMNRSLLLDDPSTPQKSSTDLSHKGSKVSLKSGTDNNLRPHSTYSEKTPNRHSLISSQLPPNIDSDALVWATVTHRGGRITLPDSGVSLTIPEGAVVKGCSEDIFLAVSRDDKDRPKLTDTQTVLGPVIVCGPKGMYLKKPVILSFQHCASIKHGQWALSVHSSLSPYDEPPQWQFLSMLGQETINTPVYIQMDLNQCHIMTETLMRYTLIGEPNMAGKAIKILRLATFAPAVPSSVDHNLRVYFVEDTQDSLEGVMQVERKLGGMLVEKSKQFLFQYGGGNLCLTIEELGPGWRCKLAANYQEIPFGHIWSGTQHGLHCSFALEQVDRSQQIMSCNIHAFQKTMFANRQVLQITCNLKEKAASTSSPAHLAPKSVQQRNSTVVSAGCSSMVSLDPPEHVFRIPPHIKAKLCDILDPPNSRGNDWRMLAQRLSVDRYINYFATKCSPTEHILDLWEARHREPGAITDLMNSLRVMGRMDAAGIIEKEMGSWL